MSKDTQDVSRKRRVNLEKSTTQTKGFQLLEFFEQSYSEIVTDKKLFRSALLSYFEKHPEVFQKVSPPTFTLMPKGKLRKLKV